MGFPLQVQRCHLNGFLLCHLVELKLCAHLFNPSPGYALGSAIKCIEVHPPYSSSQLIVLGPLSFIPLVRLTLLELAVICEGEGFFEIFVHCLPLYELIPHMGSVFLPC
jgi:hypothetical protein